MKKKKIAVIGGGASGMMAGIFAAKGGSEVCISEKNDRIGKKNLATGNGKCNFTNLFLEENCYHSDKKELVLQILNGFSPKDCISFFESMGMIVKEKNGYMYPASGQASTVLDLLRLQLSYLGVQIVTECEIERIEKAKKGYRIFGNHVGRRESYDADCVILAAGSIAGIQTAKGTEPYKLLEELGLPMIPVVPSLVQLRCKETYMKAVAGVRVDAEATLYIEKRPAYKERGEVQLTDYGVSGIPVFQLSRYAAAAIAKKKQVEIHINVLPDLTNEAYEAFCINRRVQNQEQSAEEYFLGICNKKLLQLFLKLSDIRPAQRACEISKKQKQKIFSLFRDFTLVVTGTNSFRQAQVCAGGLSMQAVDENLQVGSYPGLYVTGEILNVDGRCGGYNLQWAFASGYAAGRHAAIFAGVERMEDSV